MTSCLRNRECNPSKLKPTEANQIGIVRVHSSLRYTLLGWIIVALARVTFLEIPTGAQEACACDKTGASIRNDQGFQITILDFDIDQSAGAGSWDYEVCNDIHINGNCMPPKDLSRFDIDLPAPAAA